MSMKNKIEALYKRLVFVRSGTLYSGLLLAMILTLYQMYPSEHVLTYQDEEVMMEIEGNVVSYESNSLYWQGHIDSSELGSIPQGQFKALRALYAADTPISTEGVQLSALDPLTTVAVKLATDWAPYITILMLVTFIVALGTTVMTQDFSPLAAVIPLVVMLNYGPQVCLSISGISINDVNDVALIEVPSTQKYFVLAQVAEQLELNEAAALYARKVDFVSMESSEAKSQLIALKEAINVSLSTDERLFYEEVSHEANSKYGRNKSLLQVFITCLCVLTSLLTVWLYLLNSNCVRIRQYTNYHLVGNE